MVGDGGGGDAPSVEEGVEVSSLVSIRRAEVVKERMSSDILSWRVQWMQHRANGDADFSQAAMMGKGAFTV